MSIPKVIFCIIMCFFGLTARGATDPWTEDQRLWAVAAVSSNIGDWATTRWASRHWNDQASNTVETNRFLGNYPSTRQVDNYFLVMIPLELFLVDQMPSEYRKTILQIITVVEIGAIANNTIRIGWRLEF